MASWPVLGPHVGGSAPGPRRPAPVLDEASTSPSTNTSPYTATITGRVPVNTSDEFEGTCSRRIASTTTSPASSGLITTWVDGGAQAETKPASGPLTNSARQLLKTKGGPGVWSP